MEKLQSFNLLITLLTLLNGYFISCQTIYDQQEDPAVWPPMYCQDGRKQSPIDLSINRALYLDLNQLALSYQEYDVNIGNVELKNDGKSVVVSFKNEDFKPGVKYLGRKYLLQQFHFHWGASEHAFNGKLYDGEIHLVHFQVSNSSDILVLGALLQKTNSSDNIISNIFRQSAQNLQNYNTTDMLDLGSSNLQNLLEKVDLRKYLTYEGSLTTPNCAEGVRWIVYRDIINVDSQAIESLKQLKDSKGNNILFNNRKLQPLNGRTVFKTFLI